jgi:hypothetical protein
MKLLKVNSIVLLAEQSGATINFDREQSCAGIDFWRTRMSNSIYPMRSKLQQLMRFEVLCDR